MPQSPRDRMADKESFAPFEDDPPAPRTTRPKPTAPTDEVFDLVDDVPDRGEPVAPVPAAPGRRAAPKKRLEEDDDSRARRAADGSATVDEVWSRGAEWGPSLVVLAVV